MADQGDDPRAVTDWPARQAAAVVPFAVAGGVPVNPGGPTGRTGRHLYYWGENAAADAVVVVGAGLDRRILLVRRADAGEWAIPGGMVEPGEAAPAAATRELREETNLDLAGHPRVVLARTYVDDPRNTDWSWIATTAVLFRLPAPLPTAGGDDASAARWWPFTGVDPLLAAVGAVGDRVYPAHVPLLARAADALS